jgi:predicted ATPase
MTVTAFRLQNFMGFEDTRWIELRPITLLFGRNSSGKSALLRALLLLRQSLNSPDAEHPLVFSAEDGFDFGNYATMVRDNDVEDIEKRRMSFWFECTFDEMAEERREIEKRISDLNGVDPGRRLRLRLIFNYDPQRKLPFLCGVDLYGESGALLILASASSVDPRNAPWEFVSSVFDPYERDVYDRRNNVVVEQDQGNIWETLRVVSERSFMPEFRPTAGRPDDYQSDRRYNALLLILSYLRGDIIRFLEHVDYLAPLRPQPQRYYRSYEQTKHTMTQRGFSLMNRFHRGGADSRAQLQFAAASNWLEESCLQVSIRRSPIDKDETVHQLMLRDVATSLGNEVNICEVGYGVSQVLPVAMQAFLAMPGDTAMIEQPELHLHPRAQAELGDLFILTAKQGVRFIIETHSEHLLLRFRRRIAESTSGALQQTDPVFINASDLRAYFVDRITSMSEVEEIKIDSVGKMSSPPGFRGFFADDLQELAMLNQAILNFQAGGPAQ